MKWKVTHTPMQSKKVRYKLEIGEAEAKIGRLPIVAKKSGESDVRIRVRTVH